MEMAIIWVGWDEAIFDPLEKMARILENARPLNSH